MRKREDIILSWQSVTTYLFELIDEAIDAAVDIDIRSREEKKKNIYSAATEVLASYKSSLFNIADDYYSISIYRYISDGNNLSGDGYLNCLASHRLTISDTQRDHRNWKIGEGHVGRIFELGHAFICPDASSPIIKNYIRILKGSEREDDEERYVSFAAFPILVSPRDKSSDTQKEPEKQPIGVLILSSNVKNRFINPENFYSPHGQILTKPNNSYQDIYEYQLEADRHSIASTALESFAVQIGQIMTILET